jgi:cytochrome b involved in lipid metabolism
MTPCAEPARATRTKNETTAVVKPTITAADLAFHNKPDDVWVAIDGKVFDLTKWASLHPGDYSLVRRNLLYLSEYVSACDAHSVVAYPCRFHDFLPSGGEHLLHSTAGQDVTSVFNAFHTGQYHTIALSPIAVCSQFSPL